MNIHFELSFVYVSMEQTIAVIQAGHGLLQLGSCKIVSFYSSSFWFEYGLVVSLAKVKTDHHHFG